jgi:Raf kinase inhibitor-like YbhB/YbcL family protein
MNLISPAFADGEPIPRKFTRLGDNLCPALKWYGAPAGTKSFVLMIEDPDAPRGTFYHLGIYNIPPDWEGLPESVDTRPGEGRPRFAKNDFGNVQYDGPQPPPGHGLHHYHFRLAALEVPALSIPAAAGVEAMWREARKVAIAEAELVGTYEVKSEE